MPNPVQSITFQAMNTHIDLMFVAEPTAVAPIERFAVDSFRAAEERFSRFISGSELSQLNRVAGARCLVSEPMIEVLLLTEGYRQITDGAFNPLILQALEHLGYRETFDLVKQRAEYPVQPEEISVVNLAELLIDPSMKSIKLPPQSKLDLGGIVKSWTVDRLASDLRSLFGVQQAFVNAGGDLTAWGGSFTSGDPWVIGIEDPWDTQVDIGILTLTDGAVATSSKLGRQWSTSQGMMHHLIDPVRMLPSHSDVVQCTVIGPNVMDCEVWSKTICIRGFEVGLALFEQNTLGYEALLFTSDRRVHYYGSESSLGQTWHGIPIDQCRFRPAII
ncbi:FAD:protein FMN transferase [Cohnella yongneupensis]|uniref:FAD:protein FMN transferase n=1 Tax=Cohnella yongneupensis TaxID=425006 RepID=A0ABW0QZR2_9BACL